MQMKFQMKSILTEELRIKEELEITQVQNHWGYFFVANHIAYECWSNVDQLTEILSV